MSDPDKPKPIAWIFHGDDGHEEIHWKLTKPEPFEFACDCGRQRSGWLEPLYGVEADQWERVVPVKPRPAGWADTDARWNESFEVTMSRKSEDDVPAYLGITPPPVHGDNDEDKE